MDSPTIGSSNYHFTMDCGHGGWNASAAVVFASTRSGGGELRVKQVVGVRGRGVYIATVFVPRCGMVRSWMFLAKIPSSALQQAEEDNCNGDREKGCVRNNLGAMPSSCNLHRASIGVG